MKKKIDYMIDPTCRNINRLFVFSFKFKNGNNNPTRNSFHKYYVLLVEMKDFNALIDNKQEAYEKFVENVKKQ